jgi:hypothetical protein
MAFHHLLQILSFAALVIFVWKKIANDLPPDFISTVRKKYNPVKDKK